MNKHSDLREGLAKNDPFMFADRHRLKLLNGIGRNIGEMDVVEDRAESGGWTTSNCRVLGLGIISTIAAFKGVAICEALVAGEQLSAATCTAMVIAGGSTITEAACVTLCHNHVLQDCKE
jgi:hypothetical protein